MYSELATNGVESAKIPSEIRLEMLRRTTYNFSHENLCHREPEGPFRVSQLAQFPSLLQVLLRSNFVSTSRARQECFTEVPDAAGRSETLSEQAPAPYGTTPIVGISL
jgi:hypothetical protein